MVVFGRGQELMQLALQPQRGISSHPSQSGVNLPATAIGRIHPTNEMGSQGLASTCARQKHTRPYHSSQVARCLTHATYDGTDTDGCSRGRSVLVCCRLGEMRKQIISPQGGNKRWPPTICTAVRIILYHTPLLLLLYLYCCTVHQTFITLTLTLP